MKKLQIKFDKESLLKLLKEIKNSQFKSAFVERFIKVTDNWFTTKLYHVNEILPSYEGVVIHEFITSKEISQVLLDNNLQNGVSLSNIRIQVQTMIQEIAAKSIGKEGLVALYNAELGTITITYMQ